MGNTKVTLRQRSVSKGQKSLYLDFYPPVRDPQTMRMTRWENLGIYVYETPQTGWQKKFNKEMLDKAEVIRCMRVTSIINEEYGFLDKRQSKEDFLEYYQRIAFAKGVKWMVVHTHFRRFVNNRCSFGDVNVALCRRFRDYLLNAKQLNHAHLPVSRNSAASYYSIFRSLLKIAYKEKKMRENLNEFLEGIERKNVRKEYLTLEELRHLAATPCDVPVLKQASLFSCLTGLRISDILQLTWEEILPASEGGFCMRLCTEKTETEATLPISDEALALCGSRSVGKVFKGLQRSMTRVPLKRWLEQAGIRKKITFHCFRHTFATLQIALGTDIYTVSKMLTHKNVTTTQIYADLVNAKKRESANKISLIPNS